MSYLLSSTDDLTATPLNDVAIIRWFRSEGTAIWVGSVGGIATYSIEPASTLGYRVWYWENSLSKPLGEFPTTSECAVYARGYHDALATR